MAYTSIYVQTKKQIHYEYSGCLSYIAPLLYVKDRDPQILCGHRVCWIFDRQKEVNTPPVFVRHHHRSKSIPEFKAVPGTMYQENVIVPYLVPTSIIYRCWRLACAPARSSSVRLDPIADDRTISLQQQYIAFPVPHCLGAKIMLRVVIYTLECTLTVGGHDCGQH